MLIWLVPFVVLAIYLRAIDHPWYCSCGEFYLVGVGDKHYSQHLLDAWSVSHFGHGIFFYGAVRGFSITTPWQWSILVVLCLEVVWEMVENTPWVIDAYRKSGDRFYFGDSVVNSVGDMLVCLCGALLTAYFV